MNHLTIQNLSKTYKNGVKALNQISLEMSNGIFGLLGPNGAGKSTLMRTIAALQELDEGKIIFNEIDIIAQPQFVRQQLGYLPQEFGVYPGFSAFQLLDHLAILKGLINKPERHQQINALLDKTNLFTLRKRAVSTLSGGMRQRFGIAQALLGNPQLIIVDEPTAGLDPEERNRFLDLLSELGEDKIIILSTHIVEDVRDLCQQLAIIHNGGLIKSGSPIELIAELEGKIWQKTMSRTESKQWENQKGVLLTRLFSGQKRIFVLADHSPEKGFIASEPSLEDVYFSTFSTHI